MNHAGEIRRLVDIAEPNVRVWTNVAEVHAANFASIENIADAKAELLESSRSDDHLVANADDKLIMDRVGQFPGSVTTFGLGKDSDVRAIAVQDSGLDGVSATVETPRGSGLLQMPLIGMGNVANALASIAVALQFQIPLDAMLDVLKKFTPPDRRGFVMYLSRGVTVVDDSYNSNPTALERALESIGRTSGYRRRVAVLGEMLELGARSKALHYDCGKKAVNSGFERIVAIGGENVEALVAGGQDAGLDSDAVVRCANSEEAINVVSRLIEEEDLVLVKGSRGVQTGLVVDRLKADWS
jgi:UDP-N-acetylmuramoyl-tripeptide--D-alanyl-D-alanine ligase